MTERVPTTDPLAHVAAETVSALRKTFADAWTGPNPKRGKFAADLAEVEPLAEPARSVRGKLLLLSASGVIACWQSAGDTLLAMEADLRRRPHSVWTPMTLVRSLQEAVIFIRYQTDPNLTVEQRLVRIANVWLEEKSNVVKAAPNALAPDGSNPHTRASADRDSTVAELHSGGFNVQTFARGAPKSVELGGTLISPVGYNTASEALTLMPPGFPEAWRLASGAAHARPWYLTSNAIGGQYGPWSAWADATTTAVSCAAFALDKGAERVGQYFDADLSDARAQMEQTHRGFLTAAAVAGAGRTS